MLQLDNFLAWISIEGRVLQEYAIEASGDQRRATCYIESEEGKPFEITWRDTIRSSDSMGRTFVDGFRCGVSKGINHRGYKQNLENERDFAVQRGVAAADTQVDGDSTLQERLLVFTKVPLTDDDQFLNKPPSQHLGEIRLEISYIKKGAVTSPQLRNFASEDKIHETMQTGQLARHRTSLGGLIRSPRPSRPIHTVRSKGETRIFTFKYRPREALNALGIATPSSTRIPGLAGGSIDVIDLSMENESSDVDMEFEEAEVEESIRIDVDDEEKKRDDAKTVTPWDEVLEQKPDCGSEVKAESVVLEGIELKAEFEDVKPLVLIQGNKIADDVKLEPKNETEEIDVKVEVEEPIFKQEENLAVQLGREEIIDLTDTENEHRPEYLVAHVI